MNTFLAIVQRFWLSLEQKEGLDTMDVLLREFQDALEEIMSGGFRAFMQHFHSFVFLLAIAVAVCNLAFWQ